MGYSVVNENCLFYENLLNSLKANYTNRSKQHYTLLTPIDG